jgi:hypothetical protein
VREVYEERTRREGNANAKKGVNDMSEQIEVDPENGPCFFTLPGWARRWCPDAKGVCRRDECVCYAYKSPEGNQWYSTGRSLLEITCLKHNIVFEIWDKEYVMAQMGESAEHDG